MGTMLTGSSGQILGSLSLSGSLASVTLWTDGTNWYPATYSAQPAPRVLER
jgi:hypothetical protein